MPAKTHPGAREFLLLFPYYERGTVWDAIVRATEEGGAWPFPEVTALRVFRDACCGINAMHSQGYVHRDMKVGQQCFVQRYPLPERGLAKENVGVATFPCANLVFPGDDGNLSLFLCHLVHELKGLRVQK